MKTNLLTSRLPRLALLAGGLAVAAALLPQHAAANTLTFDIDQVGSNVVVTSSGSVDTTALTAVGIATVGGYLAPSLDTIGIGPIIFPVSSFSISGLSGPSSFGGSENTLADSATGDSYGVNGSDSELFLPSGYVDGSTLSGTATFDNTTLAALDVTDGIYTWTYGPSSQDSIVINAGVTPVPEPSTWLMLTIGMVLLVAFGRRRLALN